MTQTTISFAKAVFELDIPLSDMKEAANILRENPRLYEALSDPSVKKREKRAVADKVFPASVRNVVKLLCDSRCIGDIFDIAEYQESLAKSGTLNAVLRYADMPSASQLERIKDKLKLRYGKHDIELELKEDKSLIGGFVITCGCDEIDYSVKNRLGELYRNLIRR